MERKSKFTLEERVSMCKDYLEMGLIHKDILIKYGVFKCVFYRYINRFRIHGIEVFKRCGIKYNEKKIRRIMIEEDIVCVIRVKKKRFKKSSDEYFRDNILNRDFSTTKDNQKWSTDITEINTREGKLYISGVIDINSKMLISYEIGNHNNNELVMKTFKNININDVDILQSDRGFQYTSYMFKNITKDITHSMSRPGDIVLITLL